MILPNFHQKIFPIGQYETSKDFILDNFGGLNSTLLDGRVYEEFSSCLENIPHLNQDDFPYTYAYVEDEENKNLTEMESELKNIDIYLSEQEILYHGGIFPINNPKINDTFNTFKFFSTTIDPFTATYHAIQEEEICFWHIKLNHSVRAFPVMIDAQEESEILILDNLTLKIIDIKDISKIDDMGIERKMRFIFLEQCD